MKKFTSFTQANGKLGEDLALRYLLQKGHILLERNYTKKWGEIDIITKCGVVTHFVEVKSVTRESIKECIDEIDSIRPEDHMDRLKTQRLYRTLSIYIQQKKVMMWQFDLLCVFIDKDRKKAKVRCFEDLILEEN